VGGPTLVTGGTGFAGSHLVEHLLACGRPVAAWFNPRGHAPAPAGTPVSWRAVDLLDRSELAAAFADLSPSAVVHCAGFADVGGAWAQPDEALRVNALGTHYLLQAVEHARLQCPVLVIASALVYRPSSGALREDSPIGPSNPYGFSKLAQEMVAGRSHAGRVFIARPFNHAGPRQSPSYVTSSFARQIAEIELDRREPVLHVGNLESYRDITDVRDTVRAYQLILDRGLPGRPYNVCRGRAYRVGDLLTTLVGLSRATVTVRPDPSRMRPADIPIVLGDPSRIRDETGWQPIVPVEKTLEDLLDYWRVRIAADRA
jgi:GDP-4-dehydro-6-deoxy-D-mannose reductase